jgi:hypothetical protein
MGAKQHIKPVKQVVNLTAIVTWLKINLECGEGLGDWMLLSLAAHSVFWWLKLIVAAVQEFLQLIYSTTKICTRCEMLHSWTIQNLEYALISLTLKSWICTVHVHVWLQIVTNVPNFTRLYKICMSTASMKLWYWICIHMYIVLITLYYSGTSLLRPCKKCVSTMELSVKIDLFNYYGCFVQ